MTGEVLTVGESEAFTDIAERFDVSETTIAAQGLTGVMRRAQFETAQQLEGIVSGGGSDVNGAIPAFQSVTQNPEILAI